MIFSRSKPVCAITSDSMNSGITQVWDTASKQTASQDPGDRYERVSAGQRIDWINPWQHPYGMWISTSTAMSMDRSPSEYYWYEK